jgi:hypothetical protein
LEIEIGADVPDAAVFDIATATDEAEVYRFHRITLADLRAYLEQRDAYVAASTASRLGQSAQIEEVK